MSVGDGSERNNGQRQNQSQRPKRKQNKRASVGMSFERSVRNLSSAGRETLERVHQNRNKSLNTKPHTSCAVFDKTCSNYHWLRSRWIVEERCVQSGRLYRYYYDPVGQIYNNRQEVETICQAIERNHNIIIMDD